MISDLKNNPPRIDDKEKTSNADIQVISRTNLLSHTRAHRTIVPFIAKHDIPRGVIYALQALLGYILMLAIMCVCLVILGYHVHCLMACRTFQAAYLISIVIGLGLGEVLFGRFGDNKHVH